MLDAPGTEPQAHTGRAYSFPHKHSEAGAYVRGFCPAHGSRSAAGQGRRGPRSSPLHSEALEPGSVCVALAANMGPTQGPPPDTATRSLGSPMRHLAFYKHGSSLPRSQAT